VSFWPSVAWDAEPSSTGAAPQAHARSRSDHPSLSATKKWPRQGPISGGRRSWMRTPSSSDATA
jgi:hypothetical protein